MGLDAEAAYGFHTLREAKPWAAPNRLVNQAWYSWFSCTSGWFCGSQVRACALMLVCVVCACVCACVWCVCALIRGGGEYLCVCMCLQAMVLCLNVG